MVGLPPHPTADECDRRAPNVLTPTSCYAKGKVKWKRLRLQDGPSNMSLYAPTLGKQFSSIIIKLEYISDERFF